MSRHAQYAHPPPIYMHSPPYHLRAVPPPTRSHRQLRPPCPPSPPLRSVDRMRRQRPARILRIFFTGAVLLAPQPCPPSTGTCCRAQYSHCHLLYACCAAYSSVLRGGAISVCNENHFNRLRDSSGRRGRRHCNHIHPTCNIANQQRLNNDAAVAVTLVVSDGVHGSSARHAVSVTAAAAAAVIVHVRVGHAVRVTQQRRRYCRRKWPRRRQLRWRRGRCQRGRRCNRHRQRATWRQKCSWANTQPRTARRCYRYGGWRRCRRWCRCRRRRQWHNDGCRRHDRRRTCRELHSNDRRG